MLDGQRAVLAWGTALGDRLLPTIGNGGYDVQHYDLTINYDPVANTMVSSTDITMRATQALSEFSLDLHRNLTVAGVTIDGVAATVARDADKLIVTPAAGIANNRVFHAVVAYSGTPVQVQDPDGSFEGWARITDRRLRRQSADRRDGLVPEQQPPHATRRRSTSTSRSRARTPRSATASSSPRSTTPTARRRGTGAWAYPMATYLSTSTVGIFDCRVPAPTLPATQCETPQLGATAVGKSGRPLEIYNAFERALSTTQKTQREHRRRPPGRDREVDRPTRSARRTRSSRTARSCTAPRSATRSRSRPSRTSRARSISLSTLAHEVAHQWFGNSVTPDTWSDLWFNEGWATWWAWYWANKANGNATTVEQQFTHQLQLDRAADELEHAARASCPTRRSCSTRSRSTRARR